jgi:pyruvate dehydrogenase E2 component (dihydrolipoamide acetyltransferase)
MAVVQTLRLGDGRSLCARRWPGRGEETLVLLHGLLDSSEGWGRLCDRLTGLCVAFDLPGFGYSDPPSRGSIAGYARDVAEGLEMLRVKRMALVGHSLGGAVAAALAEMLPDRVTSLVLLAPAGFGRLPVAEAVSIPGVRKLVELALPTLLSSRLAVTSGYVTMVSNGKSPESDLVDRVTSRGLYLVDGVREATRSMTEAGRSPDAFQRRRVPYDGPVHAVWGNRDRLVPFSHRHGVHTAFPQARIHVWKGMAHHPVRERTNDLIEVVQNAIADGRVQSRPATLPLPKAA